MIMVSASDVYFCYLITEAKYEFNLGDIHQINFPITAILGYHYQYTEAISGPSLDQSQWAKRYKYRKQKWWSDIHQNRTLRISIKSIWVREGKKVFVISEIPDTCLWKTLNPLSWLELSIRKYQKLLIYFEGFLKYTVIRMVAESIIYGGESLRILPMGSYRKKRVGLTLCLW